MTAPAVRLRLAATLLDGRRDYIIEGFTVVVRDFPAGWTLAPAGGFIGQPKIGDWLERHGLQSVPFRTRMDAARALTAAYHAAPDPLLLDVPAEEDPVRRTGEGVYETRDGKVQFMKICRRDGSFDWNISYAGADGWTWGGRRHTLVAARRYAAQSLAGDGVLLDRGDRDR